MIKDVKPEEITITPVKALNFFLSKVKGKGHKGTIELQENAQVLVDLINRDKKSKPNKDIEEALEKLEERTTTLKNSKGYINSHKLFEYLCNEVYEFYHLSKPKLTSQAQEIEDRKETEQSLSEWVLDLQSQLNQYKELVERISGNHVLSILEHKFGETDFVKTIDKLKSLNKVGSDE